MKINFKIHVDDLCRKDLIEPLYNACTSLEKTGNIHVFGKGYIYDIFTAIFKSRFEFKHEYVFIFDANNDHPLNKYYLPTFIGVEKQKESNYGAYIKEINIGMRIEYI